MTDENGVSITPPLMTQLSLLRIEWTQARKAFTSLHFKLELRKRFGPEFLVTQRDVSKYLKDSWAGGNFPFGYCSYLESPRAGGPPYFVYTPFEHLRDGVQDLDLSASPESIAPPG